MMRALSLFTLGFLLLLPGVLPAQVIIIDQTSRRIIRPPVPPRPPIPHPRLQPPQSNFKVRKVDIQSNIRDQIARVQVSQSFQNISSRT